MGRLLLHIPADVADNIRGPVDQRHPLFLFSVHRDMYNAAVRQARTGIVLAGPGAVPGVASGRIVKP